MEFYRRERELLLRELDLAKRENEFLRRTPRENEPEQRQSRPVNIGTIKELLPDFQGNNVEFLKWKEQFVLLREVYQLDDNNARLLLGARLKGKALQWFQSKSEYVGMTADALLDELASIFDHRPSRMELRRKFEERVWRSNKNFSYYYHEKLILANSINKKSG